MSIQDTSKNALLYARLLLFGFALLFVVVAGHLVWLANANSKQPSSVDVNIPTLIYAVVFVSILVVLVFFVRFSVRSTAVYLQESRESPGVSWSLWVVKVLSAIPTPLLAAPFFLAFATYVPSGVGVYVFLVLILVFTALPTAIQIGNEAFESHDKDVVNAGMNLGMDRSFCLFHLCTPSFKGAFNTAAFIGIVRVCFENWAVTTQIMSGSSLKFAGLGSRELVELLKNAYEHLGTNISWSLILLLVLLSLIGHLWTAIGAFISRFT